MTSLTIKKRIMFGVYTVYFVRKLKNPFVLEVFTLGALVAILFFLVSVPSVMTNFYSSGNLYRSFISAFSHAELAVQLTCSMTLLVVLPFLKNMIYRASKMTSQLKHRFA